MTEPRKENPRLFKSEEIVSESSLRATMLPSACSGYLMTLPSVNDQMYLENDSNSSCILRNAFALLMTALILRSDLITFSALMILSTSEESYFETAAGSKSENAALRASLFLSTVIQLRPHCITSRLRASK